MTIVLCAHEARTHCSHSLSSQGSPWIIGESRSLIPDSSKVRPNHSLHALQIKRVLSLRGNGSHRPPWLVFMNGPRLANSLRTHSGSASSHLRPYFPGWLHIGQMRTVSTLRMESLCRSNQAIHPARANPSKSPNPASRSPFPSVGRSSAWSEKGNRQ